MLSDHVWPLVSEETCVPVSRRPEKWVWESQWQSDWNCCKAVCFHQVRYGSVSIFFSVIISNYLRISRLSCTDTFIQKTKRLYLDTRTQRNLAKLNDELYEVHQIMTRNVQEVLGVGEKLDRKSLSMLCFLCYLVILVHWSDWCLWHEFQELLLRLPSLFFWEVCSL
jgi:hypothetical protein